MGIARKWVFPIIRIIIFAAIAAALVKLAFLPDLGTVPDTDQPTGEIVEPQVPVTIGTILNDVTVSGTVAADSPVPIKANLTGTVREIFVENGRGVAPGDPILSLRSETPNPDGTISYDTEVVYASATGAVVGFSALVGQAFSIGDDVGKVQPYTFSVSGSLAPEQQYRLLSRPTEALVTITGGPAPFTCTGLTITTPTSAQGETGTTGPVVQCSVPAEVRVFAGLAAQMVVAGGVAENVLIVPITAVEGTAETGNVYFVLPDGSTETRPVVLGLNDGINVEVKEGLTEGDLILQFIPGAVVDPMGPGMPLPGECVDLGDGSVVCG
jgi:membrane fusion protein, macrolide-specific efflux system